MSMLEIHAEALAGPTGPYHEFLGMYKASSPIVYGFVEGKEDPSFYRGFIEQALPAGWSVRLVRSGNRKSVLSNLKEMPWERFPKTRICFFIDRDLTDFICAEQVAAENLYVTDNYSIENDVVNSHVFERVFEEVLGVTEISEAEREAVTKLFDENLNAFCEAMVPIMAQILIWRRPRANLPPLNVPLDNIKISRLIHFPDGKLLLRNEFLARAARLEYAAEAVKQSLAEDAELREAEARFRSGQGTSRFIRGKYLLLFFISFASALHSCVPKFCSRHKDPPKVRVTMGAANAMSVIGPRARAPASLSEFLKTNYCAYAAAN